MSDTSAATSEDGNKSKVDIKLPDARIQFDQKKTTKLRSQYEVARAKEEAQFVFEGHVLLTAYAKYLLEYLDERFRVRTDSV